MVAGAPTESSRLTFTPVIPVSPPEIRPSLLVSFQTRLPTLRGLKKPKSRVRFVRASVTGVRWRAVSEVDRSVSPSAVSGSTEPGPRVIAAEVIPFVAGAASSTPSSSLSALEFGAGPLTVEDRWLTSGPPVAKFVLSTWTR